MSATKRRSRDYSLSGDPLSAGGAARKKLKVKARAQCRPQAPFSRIFVKWRSVVYGRGGADAKEELSNERDAEGEDQGSCRGARETKEELNNKRHAFSAPVRDRENEMSGREKGAAPYNLRRIGAHALVPIDE